ncbi:hypothetical protein SLE2022_089030 [Rubroshorea leprosula]
MDTNQALLDPQNLVMLVSFSGLLLNMHGKTRISYLLQTPEIGKKHKGNMVNIERFLWTCFLNVSFLKRSSPSHSSYYTMHLHEWNEACRNEQAVFKNMQKT